MKKKVLSLLLALCLVLGLMPMASGEDSYQIFVKTLTGQSITLLVTGSTTVAQVKEDLVDETGVSAEDMRLIFAGRQLEDGKTLTECSIQKDASLHLLRLQSHSHPLCGASCSHTPGHNAVDFTHEWMPVTDRVTEGDYFLPDNGQITGDLTVQGTVHLCLNGKTLDMGENSIRVESGSTLILSDCGTAGRIISNEDSEATILVTGGSLEVQGGAVQSLSTAISIPDGSSGTVWVAGGLVENDGVQTAIKSLGAGTITVTGGTIQSGNEGTYGAIKVGNNCAVTVSGGTIISNGRGYGAHAIEGSVYANGVVANPPGGTVTISGGDIRSTGKSSAVSCSGFVCRISGGTISSTGNFAVESELPEDTGALHISGGHFQSGYPYAIYSNRVPFYLSGNPTIMAREEPAVFLFFSNSTVTAKSQDGTAAYEGAPLRVHLGLNSYTVGDPVVTDVTDASQGLFYPSDGYTLERVGNDLVIAHDWSYSVEGAMLTATCAEESCSYAGTDTQLTLLPPAMQVVGDGKSAEASFSAATLAGLKTLPTIYYLGAEGTEYAESDVAPTAAGDYVARIYLGRQSAQLTYSLHEHHYVWGPWTDNADGSQSREARCECGEILTATVPRGETPVEGLEQDAEKLGTDLRLTVETREEMIDPEDKAQIEAVLEEGRQAQYLDISIVDTIGGGKVSSTTKVLEIPLDFDFQDKTDVKVFRHHAGTVSELRILETRPTENFEDATCYFSPGEKRIYVYSRQFSTYVISYKPVVKATPTPVPTASPELTPTVQPQTTLAPTQKPESQIPDTGDGAQLGVWLMLAAMAAAAGMLAGKKKQA